MVIFRSFNDIVISLIENLRLSQPSLDTKPGTVARDLMIDAPAEQLSLLYNDLRTISNLQSLFSASGTDLVRLGANFGLVKLRGSNASGVAVFTTNSLESDISIPQNTVVTARNGITYKTTVSTIMRGSSSNVFRANASRLSTDLLLAGITDQFAVEIPVEAVTPGTSGNIGQFSLTSQNVAGISNITNLSSFSGGTNAESDSEFRTRILSIFAGSNTGTALGYETSIQTVSGVDDVVVVVPGDPLLTRDGTETTTDSNGNLVITDAGSGGKVDIYILGEQLESNIDSFIYNDQSGTRDPTDSDNDVILGQRGQDTTLSSSQRRVQLLADDLVPFQPVSSIVSVVGSSSGTNFIEMFTDTDGSIKGNYELFKDTGSLGGSPFGFDKLRWISNEIELEDEEVTKGIFNGSDALLFTDVSSIADITQDIFVSNENSTTSTSTRSSVQLKHYPVRTVSRVVNLTTGERYVVSDQNPDGTDELNTTGRITITGNTLPVSTDVLQVDYTWVKPYDRTFDFDNLEVRNTLRTAQDSVDWAFGNLVKNEPSAAEDDGYGNFLIAVTHPISKVIAANTYTTETVAVSSGIVTLSNTVEDVIDIRRVSDGVELYNTDAADGSLSGTASVILPSDTLAQDGDSVIVRYNATDLYDPANLEAGSFEDNVITLTAGAVDGYTQVLVSYVADIRTLLPATEISDLPAVRSDNNFSVNDEVVGDQPTSNIYNISDVAINNLRRAASHIRITAASIGSSGSVSVNGTTLHKLSASLITVISGNGYDINLSRPILTDLGVSSVPSTVKVVKLEKVERVTVDSSGAITAVEHTYDVINYRIGDNTYDLEAAIKDTSLSSTTVSLPRTTDNTTNLLDTADVVRVTFYYTVSNDTESLFFSRNGTHITNKIFHTIERITLTSGFLNASGDLQGEITVTNLNQPLDNTTYNVDYNYTAPKENERITITYNTNDLIRDATLKVEEVRPITADVLVKAATAKDIDMTIRIVLLSEFEDSEQTVLQEAKDSVTAFLNASSLGTTVDASDVVNNLYSVSGIDRVTIINFSTGTSGNVQSIEANKTEYLRAGTITITTESR